MPAVKTELMVCAVVGVKFSTPDSLTTCTLSPSAALAALLATLDKSANLLASLKLPNVPFANSNIEVLPTVVLRRRAPAAAPAVFNTTGLIATLAARKASVRPLSTVCVALVNTETEGVSEAVRTAFTASKAFCSEALKLPRVCANQPPTAPSGIKFAPS